MSGLRDFARLMGRAALLRHRAGFLSQDPPYSTHILIERCFPDVRVVGAELPPSVIELAEVRADRRTLFYSRLVDHATQRFGITHGLGHFLADLKRGTGIAECNVGARSLERAGRLPTDPVERGCDLLAAEVLVPLDVLDRYAPADLAPETFEAKAALDDITDELGSLFKVPRDVMCDRLHDLRLMRQTHFWVG